MPALRGLLCLVALLRPPRPGVRVREVIEAILAASTSRNPRWQTQSAAPAHGRGYRLAANGRWQVAGISRPPKMWCRPLVPPFRSDIGDGHSFKSGCEIALCASITGALRVTRELFASVRRCRKIRKSMKRRYFGVTEIDRPLSLRMVANLLVQHKLVEKSDKNGFDRLLGLLKTGEIRSVAAFPDVLSDPLVISQNYWKKRGRDAIQLASFQA